MNNPNISKINISLISFLIAISFLIIGMVSSFNPSSTLFAFSVAISFVSSILTLLTGLIGILYAIIGEELISKGKFILLSFVLLIAIVIGVLNFFFLLDLLDPDYYYQNYLNIIYRKERAIRGYIESTRVAAELWYDDLEGGNYTYSNVCNSSDFKRIKVTIEELGSTMRCFDSADSFCAEADLVRSKGQWCADSTGYAGPEANCSADNISCQ